MLEGLFLIILTVIGLIATIIGVASFFINIEGSRFPRKLSTALSIIGFALFIAASSITIIPPGSVGVVTVLGHVQEETLLPGIHIRLPFIAAIKQFETRVLTHNFQDLDAASSESLSMKVTGTMNYHVDGTKASELYQTLSDDFAAKIIDPAFADYIKQVIPQYSADPASKNWVLGHRDDIRAQTKEALNANLARYHIIVDDIYIYNIANPDDFEAAIRARQVAQQQVATEQQVTQQKIQQAQQAVEVAKGEANAKIQQAIGDAQASIEGNKGRLALAETQAKANKLLSDSLTPELIQYTLIQKLSDKIQLVFLPSNGNFFLDPTKLLPQ